MMNEFQWRYSITILTLKSNSSDTTGLALSQCLGVLNFSCCCHDYKLYCPFLELTFLSQGKASWNGRAGFSANHCLAVSFLFSLLSMLLACTVSQQPCIGPYGKASLSWFWEIGVINNKSLTYLLVLGTDFPSGIGSLNSCSFPKIQRVNFPVSFQRVDSLLPRKRDQLYDDG